MNHEIDDCITWEAAEVNRKRKGYLDSSHWQVEIFCHPQQVKCLGGGNQQELLASYYHSPTRYIFSPLISLILLISNNLIKGNLWYKWCKTFQTHFLLWKYPNIQKLVVKLCTCHKSRSYIPTFCTFLNLPNPWSLHWVSTRVLCKYSGWSGLCLKDRLEPEVGGAKLMYSSIS